MNWAYPALMGAAVATGVIVSRRTQRPLGLSPWQRMALGLAAFCGGMLGAKLPFVLLDWQGFLSGTAWFDNGKTLMLGLVGGYFGVEAAKWALHVQVKTGDSFAAPVAAAIAVGRLACFSAGCCYGSVTDLPWGVDFGDGARRHPTQLYEFAFHLTCAVILVRLQARGLFRGQLIKLYVIAYLIYRFATEYVRPEPKVWLDLTIYQWAALVFAPVFAYLWLRDSRALAGAGKIENRESRIENRKDTSIFDPRSSILDPRSSILALLTMLLLGSPAWCQPTKPADPKAIDAIVRDALKAWQVPGVAVGIVHKGGVVYLKGHGLRSLADSEPVTPDTLFPLASCTKAFTTTALALLVDEDKLAWDDPVRKHLPSFRLSDPLANQAVTLRDLLCHRTGLASHDWLWYREPWSPEEAVRRAGLLPLDRPFRSEFQYQSTMFTAAGLAASKAAQTPWHDLVRKRLLEPLGMKRTTFTTTAAQDLEPATGHRYNGRGQLEVMPACVMDNPDPAGSIHSCARDLCRWLLFHLADGRVDGKQLVSARNLGETHRPQMVIAMDERTRRMHPETVQMSYGLAWVIQDYRGLQLQSHAGLIDGFRVHLTLAPRERLGIVLLNNRHQTQMNLALSNLLLDHLLDLPRRDWNRLLRDQQRRDENREDERARERERQRQPDSKPSLPLADYVGRYDHPAHGQAEVTRDGATLVLRWNRLPARLEHYHFDTFTVQGYPLDGKQIQFQLGKDGKVGSLRMDEPGLKFEMRRQP